MLWSFEKIDLQTRDSVYRISSLFATLYEFYVFFQTWGCEVEPDGTYLYTKEKVI